MRAHAIGDAAASARARASLPLGRRCEPLPERILAGDRKPQPRVRERAVAEHEDRCADKAELLADDGEDHVGVRLRQVVDLLDPLPETTAEDAARADADLRLHVLEPG